MTTTELLEIHPAPWYVDNDEKGDIVIRDGEKDCILVPQGDCCIELAHAVCRMVEAYIKLERIINWQ